MAYIYNKNKEQGEIATFVSPYVWNKIHNNDITACENIIEINCDFLSNEYKYIVDMDYLKKYKIKLNNNKFIFDEENEMHHDFIFDMKPVGQSKLKEYLKSISK